MKDMLGTEIEPGHVIAYATMKYRKSVMKMGVVSKVGKTITVEPINFYLSKETPHWKWNDEGKYVKDEDSVAGKKRNISTPNNVIVLTGITKGDVQDITGD